VKNGAQYIISHPSEIMPLMEKFKLLKE